MLLIFIIQSFLKTRCLCCYTEVSFSNYSCKYWKYTQLVVQTFDSSFVECNSFDFFDASVPILIIITLNTSKWQTRLLLSAKLSPDTMTARQGLLRTNQRWGLWSRDPRLRQSQLTCARRTARCWRARPRAARPSRPRRSPRPPSPRRTGTRLHRGVWQCEGMARLSVVSVWQFWRQWCKMMFDNIRRGPLYYGLRLVHLNMVSPPEIGTMVCIGLVCNGRREVS